MFIFLPQNVQYTVQHLQQSSVETTELYPILGVLYMRHSKDSDMGGNNNTFFSNPSL